MYKTEFQTYAVDIEDISRAFKKIGFEPVPTGSRVPAEVIRNILNANPDQKELVVNGEAEFVPLDYREWGNNDDIISATDYEIREPIRYVHDPFITVKEIVPGRTSSIVKQILLRELQVDTIKFSISRGLASKQTKQCIKELAQLTGEDPRKLYGTYKEQMMMGWISIVNTSRPLPTKISKRSRNIERGVLACQMQ